VGLIFLLGPGGRESGEVHVAGTSSLLERAPLGPGDLIYFSRSPAPPAPNTADSKRSKAGPLSVKPKCRPSGTPSKPACPDAESAGPNTT